MGNSLCCQKIKASPFWVCLYQRTNYLSCDESVELVVFGLVVLGFVVLGLVVPGSVLPGLVVFGLVVPGVCILVPFDVEFLLPLHAVMQRAILVTTIIDFTFFIKKDLSFKF
jgi:hypothetical protein